MSRRILELKRYDDIPEAEIISLVGEAVGEQFTELEFAHIGEVLSGEDYVIAELFFPSLKYMYDIIKSQKDDSVQTPMTIRFATMMRYAVWKMYDPSDLEPDVQPILQDCAHLFLQTCYSISEVDDKRYLLMGVAAAVGDSEAAKRLHDLAGGY